MEFDLGWILLGLPLAFVLGWLASRFDLRQLRAENRRAPKAYFKGLNFLLNEQQDQAIDAFIEAVQNDPDTCELHFALGNLFRRRGEYDRAVRVHEHLLSRGDLEHSDRERAQHALALDFLKAGLLDRAEDALHRLEGTALEAQARLALLAIYERSRDWPRAAGIARKMHGADQGDFSTRQAHYLCEQALALTDLPAAQALLEQAIHAAPEAARARIELARLQRLMGQPDALLATLKTLAAHNPAALPLAAPLMVEAASATGRVAEVQELLQAHYAQAPSLDVLESIVLLETADEATRATARQRYVQHLDKERSLVATAKWLATEKLEHEEFHPQIERALEHAVKPLLRYRCAACGFEARRHFWQCPGCQTWDSYPARRVEEL
ncbi:lipopolysaccharide assembly protein LapB [Verminephrobacter aporrectodeae]|uniref:Lipopolysaccharide assembly protein B n=2 Tax=Verminephrobacter TaxID=364316 RepID=A0ABT3KY11_9BURK|nr:lipopolysaccharide assembly protein LapB [Verminephrobacter aporrectodeae]MCW5258070.1 lipopolysaccharide assembly protein LapB [Verminephrobacter aporrectodeae subsp. tuberculatae]MCW5322789.1 lipopolysaccharide assembly protein LapB [Verminephrobacter aporrectodeae subsp. tuberculatae]MCW8175776.1 lipopolysaccharide assembly protein LapB [Verminephrobacter aporrectodeae subsp. tuberculatae]MCW8198173.1 lipopolysaccharide assembly protein LapB [Verminephrobacter aporrectodeae subsp. tubercu